MGVKSSLITLNQSMVPLLLRKHGGKTGAELKAKAAK